MDTATLRTAGLSARKADYGRYLHEQYNKQPTYMLFSSRSFCEVCWWPIIDSETSGGQWWWISSDAYWSTWNWKGGFIHILLAEAKNNNPLYDSGQVNSEASRWIWSSDGRLQSICSLSFLSVAPIFSLLVRHKIIRLISIPVIFLRRLGCPARVSPLVLAPPFAFPHIRHLSKEACRLGFKE